MSHLHTMMEVPVGRRIVVGLKSDVRIAVYIFENVTVNPAAGCQDGLAPDGGLTKEESDKPKLAYAAVVEELRCII